MKSFNFSSHGIICSFNFKQVPFLISILPYHNKPKQQTKI